MSNLRSCEEARDDNSDGVSSKEDKELMLVGIFQFVSKKWCKPTDLLNGKSTLPYPAIVLGSQVAR